MKRLIDFLFNTNTPLWRYCLLVLPLATIPSAALLVTAGLLLQLAGLDPTRYSPPAPTFSPWAVIASTTIAPIFETFLLAAAIAILSVFITSKIRVAIVSAVLWGIFHGLFGLLWFFGSAWSFFVLSCAYLAWRGKSFKHAYYAALIPHVLNNTIATIVLSLTTRT